jgi:Lysine-specific metallo-endopeptidase
MTGTVSLNTSPSGAPTLATDPFAGMAPKRSADTQRASRTLLAPAAVAVRDATTYSSRSLTSQERQLAGTALKNAKDLLQRTESSLRENWNKRVPGSTLTNKQVFRQHFGDNSEALRTEVLARVQRVRDKVDTVLGQNLGNTVVRATGKRSDYSAYVDPVSAKISLGDRFFTYRSPSPLSSNSQAGVFVHELSHTVQYNGRKSVDEVPGYAKGDKRAYSEQALKTLANTNPSLAVANSNLLMWYVTRQK